MGGSGGPEGLLLTEDAVVVHVKLSEKEDLLVVGRYAPLRTKEMKVEELKLEKRRLSHLHIVRGPTHLPHVGTIYTTSLIHLQWPYLCTIEELQQL